MQIRKILKKFIAVTILGSLLFTMSACKKPGEVNIFKDQLKNEKYYVQTGVPENWSVQADPDDNYLDAKTGLLFHIYPNESSETRSPQFSAYHKKDEMIQLTLNIAMQRVKDDFDKSGREQIVQEDAQNVFKRKMQYKQVKYSFQKNGDTWKGEYYVITVNDGYLVLVYEGSSKAVEGGTSDFDKNYSTFSNIMEDFRILGFEEDKDVG